MQAPTRVLAIAALAAAGAATVPAAQAQDNAVKLGIARYTTDSKSNGITGIGVPAGADAETGNASTALLLYERMVSPNLGVELALGVPPRIKAQATGSVAFLGEVLSAKVIAPTVFVNWHFGRPGDTWRPYVGLGLNYSRFVGIRSSLASSVQMKDSWGPAANLGLEYAVDRQWSLWGSVTALRTKTKLVASGSTVLQATIDFRPVVFAAGALYRF